MNLSLLRLGAFGLGFVVAAALAPGQVSSPFFTVPMRSITDVDGAPIRLAVTPAVPDALTYQWRRNGAAVDGGNSPILEFVLNSATAGFYSITAKDGDSGVEVDFIRVAERQGYAITTLAGRSLYGSADGTGLAAEFNEPRGVASDGVGNLYIVDSGNNLIRKMTPAGVVTIFAGVRGMTGSTDGDGRLATFNAPFGIAIDGGGNLFIADSQNHVIREITPDGIVSTLAGLAGSSGSADGTGAAARFNQPCGVAIDSAGNVYVADTFNEVIRKVTPAGVVTTLAGTAGNEGLVDGTGPAAKFSTPFGVAVDGAGNVFVADSGNSKIRKVTPAGVVSTYANSGNFILPQGIAIDGSGNVYVADTLNEEIKVITPAENTSVLAGVQFGQGFQDGTGAAARFNYPFGLVVDDSGNVVVADSANGAIREVTAAGVVTTIAGGAGGAGHVDGTGNFARFSSPAALAVDGAGNILVADSGNNAIRRVTSGGVVTTLAGGTMGNMDGTGSAASFNAPGGIAVDAAGNAIVADTGNQTIRKVTPGGVVTTIAGAPGSTGSTDGAGNLARFYGPASVTTDGAGNIYVVDSVNNTIRQIAADGTVSTLAGVAGSAGSTDGVGADARFNGPSSISADGAGNLYVADFSNRLIRKIAPGGVVTTVAGSVANQGANDGPAALAGLPQTTGLAADRYGNVFMVDPGLQLVRRLSATGQVETLAGWTNQFGAIDGRGGQARFDGPYGIAVDGSGRIYVADTFNNAIRVGVPYLAGSSFNGDGGSDLVWQNSATGERLVWLLDGTSFVAPVSLGTIATDWSIAATGDFDHDGQTDFVWQNTVTGERLIWLMDGTTYRSSVALGTVATDWSIVGAGDFNTDGNTDLVWQNATTGECAIWLMNGTSYVSTVSLGIFRRNVVVVGTADFGDGQSHLVVENTTTGAVSVWEMTGTSVIANLGIGTLPAHYQVAAVGDYNGDGQPDLLLSNTVTGDRVVWFMNGTTVIGNTLLTTVPPEWTLGRPFPPHLTLAAPADFNADGLSDIVWQDTASGDRVVWLMSGLAHLANVDLGTISTDWSIAANADLNGDGGPDLIWQNTVTGERLAWLMNGTAYVSSAPLGTIDTAWIIAGAGDFDGDGKPDLVWQNSTTGERYLWLMNGTAFGSSVNLGTISTDWSIVGVGDFNGDLEPDLLWQNNVTGERYLWLMNGTAFASAVSLGTISTDWKIAGTGDFSGDGQADILWQNTVTGDRYLWLMDGTWFGSSVYLGTVSTDWVMRN